MTTLFLILCPVFLTIFVAAIFLPLLRGRNQGPAYFSGGSGAGGDIRLRRRVLVENLRDLSIEKESGKFDSSEFERLAGPLAAELDRIEQSPGAQTGARPGGGTRANRHFCPACGARESLYRPRSGAVYCEQCGTEFPDQLA